jgi:tryptophan 2,3-dioxygenase
VSTPACPFSSAAVDISDESIHWDPALTYDGYLNLEPMLQLQSPRSGAHDELMFVVIHQASELWMKLAIYELTAAMREVATGGIRPALKMLARVSRIQAQLTQSWSILATLTPSEYTAFRPSLGESSGFQSYQYRELEFRLGNKNAAMIRAHRNNPRAYGHLAQVLREPSLYDLVLRLLGAASLGVPEAVIARDYAIPYLANEDVERAWLAVYREPARYWDLYELAEKLVDVEHQFQLWRFSHLKTVERIIGYKRGTGGTSGVSYLERALSLRFFPELWTVRTAL